MDGFVAIHRKIVDNWVWKDKPFSKGQAWIDLIILANHAETSFLFGNEIVVAQKGEIITSEVKLSNRWGWSRHKVRDFLSSLEKHAMLVKKPAPKRTDLIICNYSLYNDIPAKKRTSKGQIKDSHGTDAGHNQPLEPQEPLKPQEPINESVGASRFTAPTVDEVQSYCNKRNNSVDPQRFYDYYESNGWRVGKNPMKNWQAAVRTWEKGEAGKPKRKTFYDLAMEDGNE